MSPTSQQRPIGLDSKHQMQKETESKADVQGRGAVSMEIRLSDHLSMFVSQSRMGLPGPGPRFPDTTASFPNTNFWLDQQTGRQDPTSLQGRLGTGDRDSARDHRGGEGLLLRPLPAPPPTTGRLCPAVPSTPASAVERHALELPPGQRAPSHPPNPVSSHCVCFLF